MVQICIDGTPFLFTIRLTTYGAFLQAIVSRVQTNSILPVSYLDRTENTFVHLQDGDLEPLRRKTHVKIRLGNAQTVPYEGDLNSEGKKHGQGTYRWPNGRTYVGEWCENRMHGEGLETWPNGSSYQGHFKENKRHGHGIFTWPDGRQYIGRARSKEPYHRTSARVC